MLDLSWGQDEAFAAEGFCGDRPCLLQWKSSVVRRWFWEIWLYEVKVLSFGFLVSSCKTRNPKPVSHYPAFNWIAIDVGFVDGCCGFDIVFPRKVILR